MIYIAYLRKSEEDKKRQIQSIPRQRTWCDKTANRRSLRIHRIFQDGCSAHRQGRPGFEEMMNFIEQSKEPIGILTWKISRLARNPIDEGRIKDAFIRSKIVHIVSRDREYREGENQIIMGVDFGQATQYSIELSKDVTDGMKQKLVKGYRPCLAPYGYKNDPYGLKGERKIFIDEEYFEPIKKFLKLYHTGAYSVPELRTKMTRDWGVLAKNGRPFALSTLYRLLELRFYCGQYDWNGTVQQGRHIPMISIREYERIQQLLKREKKPRKNNYQNHYSGLIKCGYCSSSITGYSKVKFNSIKGKTTYHYLKCTKKKDCTCPQSHLNRAALDIQLLTYLNQLVMPKKVLDFVVDTVQKAEKVDVHNAVRNTTTLKKQATDLENQIETLTRKLLKGIVTDDMYAQLNKKLEAELALCKGKMAEGENPQPKIKAKSLEANMHFGNEATSKFVNGSFEERKLILHEIGSNFTLKNSNLKLELRQPFSLIRKNQYVLKAQNTRLELGERLSMIGISLNCKSEIPGWSSFWEEIRTSLNS